MKKNKCKKCVWANKISEELIVCLFPSCIKRKDKKNGKASGNL